MLKTLLDRKLIATAGRKNVLGKPMMYKTTREFLIQFGLDSLAELPTLKEFEELGRLALTDEDVSPEPAATPAAESKADAEPNASAPEEPGAPSRGYCQRKRTGTATRIRQMKRSQPAPATDESTAVQPTRRT